MLGVGFLDRMIWLRYQKQIDYFFKYLVLFFKNMKVVEKLFIDSYKFYENNVFNLEFLQYYLLFKNYGDIIDFLIIIIYKEYYFCFRDYR